MTDLRTCPLCLVARTGPRQNETLREGRRNALGSVRKLLVETSFQAGEVFPDWFEFVLSRFRLPDLAEQIYRGQGDSERRESEVWTL